MSAQFVLLFRGHPMRVVKPNVMEVCAPEDAAIFVAEADAWWMAFQAKLEPQHVRVSPSNQVKQEAACH